MESIIKYIWLIPTVPLLASGIAALLTKRQRRLSAGLAIGAIGFSFVLACAAFSTTLHGGRTVINFHWFDFGTTSVQLGWVLDPLGAIMAVMVTLVSLLIFIYSLGYMAKDENFGRFFCFLALFAAAMLGLIFANSLLLFFICWELVGLASYLLIGFWFQKPSAAAAAKKAFITTRIGDMGPAATVAWRAAPLPVWPPRFSPC
jgi:NADH-quinone oxidoreductase subunit L